MGQRVQWAFGLQFEYLWEAKLSSSNVFVFFCDYFASCDPFVDIQGHLAEVERRVKVSMRHIESCEEQKLAGRASFHGIVRRLAL
jgi:hypothetical protein